MAQTFAKELYDLALDLANGDRDRLAAGMLGEGLASLGARLDLRERYYQIGERIFCGDCFPHPVNLKLHRAIFPILGTLEGISLADAIFGLPRGQIPAWCDTCSRCVVTSTTPAWQSPARGKP